MYAASLVVVLAAEACFHGHTNLQRFQLAVNQVEEPPAAAFEVNESIDGRRAQAEGQQVASVGEQRSPSVGEAVGIHLLDSAAARFDAHLLRWVLSGAAASALGADQAEDHPAVPPERRKLSGRNLVPPP